MISAHVIAKYFLGDIEEANILCAEDIFYCIGIFPSLCLKLSQIILFVSGCDYITFPIISGVNPIQLKKLIPSR